MKYEQASWDYVKDYYKVWGDRSGFPKEYAFRKFYGKRIKGNSILNVGCGPLFFDDCLFFEEMPKEYVGFDINRTNLEFAKKSKVPRLVKARKKVLASKTRWKLLQWDVLKYKKEFFGKFDAIFTTETLGILNDKNFSKAINNLYKYIRPGGLMLHQVMSDCNYEYDLDDETLKYGFDSSESVGVWNMEKLFKKAKFKIIKHDVLKVSRKRRKFYGCGEIHAFLVRK